jgi:hypothetical protein
MRFRMILSFAEMTKLMRFGNEFTEVYFKNVRFRTPQYF